MIVLYLNVKYMEVKDEDYKGGRSFGKWKKHFDI